MDFKKRLKTRAILAGIYIVLGLGLMATGYFAAQDMASSFGLMLLVVGLARLLQLRRISRTEESLKQREIAEQDERSIMLYTKARSLAFVVYIIASAVAVIVLMLLGHDVIGQTVSICFLALVLIYWICYFTLRRRY